MRIFVLPLLTLTLSLPVHATDGVLEINQACAVNTGCFPGDAAGFPVKIDKEGSYRLTGNLDLRSQPAPENVTAIEIITSLVTGEGVSLDLNGFVILGSTNCTGNPTTCSPTGSGVGIKVLNNARSVAITNGKIIGMGSHGISGGGSGMRIERVNAFRNGGTGIIGGVGGVGTIVRNCTAVGNGGKGIEGGSHCLVTGNTVDGNGSDGIVVLVFCQVTSNTVTSSGGVGIEASGLVIGNLVRNNAGFGLNLASGLPGLAAYSQNHVTQNNGGNTNPQVSGGIEIGTNLCGTNTTCP